MTYIVSASSFRLGYSISWSSTNSPIYFNKATRLNIMLNVYLKGMLKLFKIKLVKWLVITESKNIKLCLITLYKSYSEYHKVRHKKRRFKYAFWNKIYFHRVTQYLKSLTDYYAVKIYLPKVNLGSGRFWHKHFKTIFFTLGKNRGLHKTKVYKTRRNIDTLAVNRSFDLLLKKNISIFRTKKIANFPQMQFYHIFNYKFLINLNYIIKSFFRGSTNSKLKFKLNFLKSIIFINYFIKNLNKPKNNRSIKRLSSRFANTSNAYYNFFFFRVVPTIQVKFDYFSHITSITEGWNFKDIISEKKINFKAYNTPWASLFIKGFYSVQSFKKIIRRRFLDIFDKNKERRRLINYSIKKFVFKRLYINKKYTYFKNFFFNKHFTTRVLNIKKALLNKFLYKKKNNFIKNFKYLLAVSLKKKKEALKLISKFEISNQLRSGDYFYSKTPNEFIDRYGFFREFTWYIKSLRFKFLNKIRLNKTFNFTKYNLISLYKFLFLKYINFCLFKLNKLDISFFCSKFSNITKDNSKILLNKYINKNNLLINHNVNISYLLKYFFVFSQLNYQAFNIKLNVVKKRFYLYIIFLINFLKINYGFYLYRLYKTLKLSRFNFKYIFKRSVNNKYTSFKSSLLKNYYYKKGTLLTKKKFQYLTILSDFLIRQKLLWTFRSLFNFIFLKINYSFKNKYYFFKKIFIKKNKVKKNKVFNSLIKLKLFSNIFYAFDTKYKRNYLKNFKRVLKKKKYKFLLYKKVFNRFHKNRDFVKLLNYLKFNRNIPFLSKKKLILLRKRFVFLKQKSFSTLPILWDKEMEAKLLKNYNFFIKFLKNEKRKSLYFLKIKKSFFSFLNKKIFFNYIKILNFKKKLERRRIFKLKLKIKLFRKKIIEKILFKSYFRYLFKFSYFKMISFINLSIRRLRHQSFIIQKLYNTKEYKRNWKLRQVPIDALSRRHKKRYISKLIKFKKSFLTKMLVIYFSFKRLKSVDLNYLNSLFNFKKLIIFIGRFEFLSWKFFLQGIQPFTIFNYDVFMRDYFAKYQKLKLFKTSAEKKELQFVNYFKLDPAFIPEKKNSFIRLTIEHHPLIGNSPKLKFFLRAALYDFNKKRVEKEEKEKEEKERQIAEFKKALALKKKKFKKFIYKKKNLKMRIRNKKKGSRIYYNNKSKLVKKKSKKSKKEEKAYRDFIKRYFYLYFLPKQDFSRIANFFFPKLIRRSFLNGPLWLKMCLINYRFSKAKWLKILINWNALLYNFKKVIYSDLKKLNFNKVYYIITKIQSLKQKRQWVNNWQLNKNFFFGKLYWARIKARVLKRRGNKKAPQFPFKNRRRIAWWRYRLIFNKSLSMQFTATGRHFNRYRANMLKRMSYSHTVSNFISLKSKILKVIIQYLNYTFFNYKNNFLKCYFKNLNFIFKDLLRKRFNIQKYFFYIKQYMRSSLMSKILISLYNYKQKYIFILFFDFIFLGRNKLIEKNFKSILGSFADNKFFKLLFLLKKLNKNFKFIKKEEYENEEINLSKVAQGHIYSTVDWVVKKNWIMNYKGKFFDIFNNTKYSILDWKFYLLKDFDVNRVNILNNFNLLFLISMIQKLRNSKKIIFFFKIIKKLINFKIFYFFKKSKSLNFKLSNSFFNFYNLNLEFTKIFFYYKLNLTSLLKIYRIKNFYFFNVNNYTLLNWLRNRKFLFWMEQEFEKTLKSNVKLSIINVSKAVMKLYRSKIFLFYKFIKIIYKYRMMGGWREQTIYSDILWIFLISIKYYSSSFLADMIGEQIIKRKKHWGFIKRVRSSVNEILPSYFGNNPMLIDGIRISINGKINGKNRSTNHLIYKYYKDLQITKLYWITLKVDYSLIQAKSMYGSFGIRVWFSRV